MSGYEGVNSTQHKFVGVTVQELFNCIDEKYYIYALTVGQPLTQPRPIYKWLLYPPYLNKSRFEDGNVECENEQREEIRSISSLISDGFNIDECPY